MSGALPVASEWFRVTVHEPGVVRIDEPFVHEFVRGNIWHVRGSHRDLVVDSGLGVASLRRHLPELFVNNPVLVVTHAHLDHAGSAHEFADRRFGAGEPTSAIASSLRGPALAELLELKASGMPEFLLDAVPETGFLVDDYKIADIRASAMLEDRDEIELGDRVFSVLLMPGHTTGSVCLFEEASGMLFSGDVLYDGPLLDEIRGSDIPRYIESMRRLRDLPMTMVYPGHGAPTSPARARELIDEYLHHRQVLSR